MRNVAIPGSHHGAKAPITGVATNSESTLVATSSYDGTVRVWSLGEDGRPKLQATANHRRLTNSVSWSPTDPTLLASASADKSAAVWRFDGASALTMVNQLTRHTDDVNSVAWLPDSDSLVCVSEDGNSTQWNRHSGEYMGSPGSHAAHAMMASVSRVGVIASVGEDGQVQLYDTGTGKKDSVQYKGSVEGCSWSPDGELLAVARDDGKVDILDRSLTATASFPVSTSAARSVAWSEDGQVLAVGSYQGGVKTYNRGAYNLRNTFDSPSLWARSISFIGRYVITGSYGSEPLVFDDASGDTVSDGGKRLRGPNAIADSPNGPLIGTDSGELLRIAESGEIDSLYEITSPILSIALDASESVYLGTYTGHVHKLELNPEGEYLQTSETALDAPVPSLLVGSTELTAGTYNSDLVQLNLDSLEERGRCNVDVGSVKSQVFTADRDHVISGTDGTVSIVEGGQVRPIIYHGNLVNGVAASGNLVASASRDRTVRVTELNNGKDSPRLLRSLTGADESVKAVGILRGASRSPFVVAGSYDFALYGWDLSSGSGGQTPYKILETFGQGISCIAQSSDSELYVAGWDGRIVRVTVHGTEMHSTTIGSLLE